MDLVQEDWGEKNGSERSTHNVSGNLSRTTEEMPYGVCVQFRSREGEATDRKPLVDAGRSRAAWVCS